ncbi:hypothetical protein ES708_05868 [subsurface metagenome]
MTSEFDEIQQLIAADIRKTYTATVIDHAMNPRNLSNMEDPNGFAQATGSCGDVIKIWIRVKNGIIAEATFWADGCGSGIATGSMVTELAKGKAISEALKITQQDVLDGLGGLPEESTHCALLAATTLREAIKDYLALKEEPWKRAYRQH